MSQGRGWSLGEEISIEYIHQTSKQGGESLLICKPMGSSLAKEVGYFVKSENLDIVTITNEDTSLITTGLQGDNSSVGPAKIEKDIKKIGIGKLVEGKITNAPPPFSN
jgi:ethanolamine utilization microcompartment shell protein EutS